MSYHYYEVLDSSGNRICMCGTEADARMMMSHLRTEQILGQVSVPETRHSGTTAESS